MSPDRRSITDETKKTMKKILTDIQDGTFAKEFLLDMSPAGSSGTLQGYEKAGRRASVREGWRGDP